MRIAHDKAPSLEARRRIEQLLAQFRIGERVRFARFFQDLHARENPGRGWNVVFDAADGTRYVATQTYFVTDDRWQNIKRFYDRRLMRDPNQHKAKQS